MKNKLARYKNPEMTHEEARRLLWIKRETVTHWIRGIDKKANE